MVGIIILPMQILAQPELNNNEDHLSFLFQYLEKDFTGSKFINPERDEERKHSTYKPYIPLPGVNRFNTQVNKFDNGMSYLSGAFSTSANKDKMVEALKAFPSSRGYKVSQFHSANGMLQYVVSKTTGKNVGFIKIYKHKENWVFHANVAMDMTRFKSDLEALLRYAKTDFSSIKGNNLNKKVDGYDKYELNKEVRYMYSKDLYIKPDDIILAMVCVLYSREAIIYQLDKNPPNLSGYTRTKSTKDGIVIYAFENSNEFIDLELRPHTKTHLNTSFGIARVKKESTETSKPNNTQSLVSIPKVNYKHLNQIYTLIKPLSKDERFYEVFDELREKGGNDMKKRKEIMSKSGSLIREQRAVMNDVLEEISKLNKSINPNNCREINNIIEDTYYAAKDGKKKLSDALYSMGLLQSATTVKAHNYYGKGVVEHFEGYRGKLANIMMHMEKFRGADYDCLNEKNTTNDSNNSSDSKVTEYTKVVETYLPIPNSPFKGNYHGDDLCQLLTRHKNDPAVKSWLSNSLYQFKQEKSYTSDYQYYKGKGVELVFNHEHLQRIKISSAYPFKNMPEGIQLGQVQNSFHSKWKKRMNVYAHESQNESRQYESKEGYEYTIYYNKTSQRVNNFELYFPTEPTTQWDVDHNYVGVGMELKKKNGKLTVEKMEHVWAAYNAGIRWKDEILFINEKSTSRLSASDAERLLRGKYQSKVKVTFLKNGKEYQAELIRGAGGKGISSEAKPIEPVQPVGVGLKAYNNATIKGNVKVEVVDNGWAAKEAGIKQGALIYRIGNTILNKSNAYKVSSLLTGDKGSTVEIAIYHMDDKEAKVYQLERGKGGKAAFLRNEKLPQKAAPKPNTNTTSSNVTTSQPIGVGMTYFAGKGSDLMEVMWITQSGAAYKAGVREGDFILKVNGKDMKNKSESDAAQLIEGQKGGKVTITVDRNGKIMNFTITR